MSLLPAVLTDRLIDVASGDDALATYLGHSSVVGLLEVRESALVATAGAVPAEEIVDVCVVAEAGAGSLLALARRGVDRLAIRAVRTVLRDLDDLVANVGRVTAAARDLPEDVIVRVGLPDTPGWLVAAEEVEASGLEAAVEAGDRADAFAARLSALIELDLPFSISRSPYPVTAVLSAVDLLIDGAEVPEAAAVLVDATHRERRWDQAASVRVRRRLRAVVAADPGSTLRELGLIE